jgi:molecular chaperone GrpE
MKRTFLNVTSTSTSVSSSLLCYNQNSLLNQGNLLNNINTRVAYRFNSTEANSGKETKKDEKKEEKKEEEKKEDKKEPEMDPVVKKLFESKDKKISDLQNAYKRALADTENIRERTRKEIQKSTQFAIQKFAKDLLDISDILKMALESVPENKRNDKSDNILYSLFTGVNMTRTQLLNTFKKHGLEMFNPLGETFDANKHQAMFQTPMADKEPGIIISVQKEGYILNGRILRPAQVGVSKKPEDNEKK